MSGAQGADPSGGEAALLARILPILAGEERGSAGLPFIGPGDDAAFVPLAGGALVTVDAVVEGQDFVWAWPCGLEHDPRDVGYKSVAQNVSDVNAMGGVPRWAVVSLQFPKGTPSERLEGIARGMREALDELAPECRIVGGDLGRAGETASTVTVLGEAGPAGPKTRSGARPGDVVAVAGTLGRAAAGLALLLGDREIPERLMPWVRAQFRPVPPMQAGHAAGTATAMMDVSDSLARDARRLAAASGAALALEADALAQDIDALMEPAAFLGGGRDLAQEWVLTGGEDFALLAAFPSREDCPKGFRVIGEVRAARPGAPAVALSGRELAAEGWDHLERD